MEAARIRIVLDLDGSAVTAGLAGATRGLASFERTSVTALNRVKTAFTGLGTAQKLLIGFGLGAAVVATSLQAVLGPAIAFESAFAGVKKTVEGTPAQLQGIRDGLIGLSTVIPTTANELAGIAENAGQLGVQAPNVLQFTEVVAKLGETTDLSFDSAAQSLARFLNITEGGVGDIQGAADVLVDLGNNSATTESQILTFATRLAASFTAAGAGKEEILGVAAAYSSLGIEAEAGGSALSRVVTEISDSAKLGNDNLDVFAKTAGLLPEEFQKIALANPVEALRLFNEGLGAIVASGGSVTPVLDALGLSGIRLSRVLTIGALGNDLLTASLERADQALIEGAALNEEYGKRAETTSARLDVLKGRITAVAIAAGTPALGAFAESADLLGVAIEAVVRELGPLTDQTGVAFQNGAAAASAFFDVLGGPALGAAVSGLNGVAVAATGILGALNSLGPAGLVIAALVADIALVGPVTSAAVLGIAGMAAGFGTVGVSATLAAAATTALNTAIATGPWIVAAVAAASLGKAFIDAGAGAREAGEAIETAFNEALSAGNFQQAQAEIGGITARMRELAVDGQIGDVNGSWERWRGNIIGAGQALTPFTENTVLDARNELDALRQVAEDNGFGNFGESVRLAANALGVSESSVVTLASEMGILGQLTASTNDDFFAAVTALQAFHGASQIAEIITQDLYDRILSTQAGLQEYADGLGLTGAQLAFVAAATEDVDLDDLVTGEGIDRMNAYEAIAATLNGTLSTLAEAAGLSKQEFIDQRDAVLGLASAHDSLREAIDGTLSAYEKLNAQQATVADSTDRFAEALQGIDGTDESLNTAADAMRNLSAESAGLADSADLAALNQTKLYGEFRIAALEAGATEEAIQRAAIQYGLLDKASLATIQAEGAKLRVENELLEQTLIDLAKEWGIELTAVDNATPVIQVPVDALLGFAGAYTAELEAINNASTVIEPVFASATAYGAGNYVAELTAINNASSVIEPVFAAATAYGAGNYDAPLSATDNASAVIATPQAGADAFASGDYNGQILATDNASAIIATPQGAASAFDSGFYNAQIQATDQASTVIARPQLAASAYTGGYNATLSATDNASGTINRAVGSLSGFRSKSITLTTYYRTVRTGGGASGSGFQADGGYYPAATHFANGGHSFPNPLPATVGRAEIYSPLTRARIHSEPETEGESYIPLAKSKRRRSIKIWEETGRHLGVMADGGIQRDRAPRVLGGTGTGTIVSFAPSIQMSVVAAEGMSPTEVGDVVEQRMERTMKSLARELRNVRL